MPTHGGMRRNTTEVFWSRVDRSGGDDACWPWTGRCQPSGHGVYDHDGTWNYAHRYAYILTYGQPQDFVLHRCDNAPCCNVLRHLYDGTQAQNVQDREERGRRTAPRGEASALAKLSDVQVGEVIRLYATGQYTQRQLGAMFGVDASTISYSTRGKRRLRDGSWPTRHAGIITPSRRIHD
jgi:hypothetical protein